jgi:hypothetical protein
MATPTYDLLASTTLTSSASSVTFSSIDQSYGDLIVVVEVNTGAGVGIVNFKFNNDAVTEVEWVSMEGDGSSATSGAFGGVTHFQGIITNSNTALHTLQLADYSATDKHTSGLYRGNSSLVTRASALRWLSTSAVTRLDVASGTNQFQTGSTFNLYGVAK